MILRGLETHSFPPAGRFNTAGSGARPVPVRAQLGGGAAHSARATGVAPGSRSSGHGVQSTHGTPGRTTAHMQARGRSRRSRRCIRGRAWSQVGVQLGAGSSVPLERNLGLLRGGRHGHDSRGMAAAWAGPGSARSAGCGQASGSAVERGSTRRRRLGGGGPREEPGGIEDLFTTEHVVDGAAELVGEDGQGLGLAVLAGRGAPRSAGPRGSGGERGRPLRRRPT